MATGKTYKDYFAIANQYALDVESGKILACKYVKQACQRHLNDLRRVDFEYGFSPELANRACKFIELLQHIKGKWANSRIILEPWQIFIVCSIFGWVHKEKLIRRFKTAYICVPRKNAKSTLAAGIALYMAFVDGEEGAEVYSAATTREQAKIVWEVAKKMAEKAKGLKIRFGVETFAHTIFSKTTSSFFKSLSRDSGGNLDGLNVHCAIIDELHAHKTRDIYDVLETATGARSQPLLFLITTAGFNRAGICFEIQTYVDRILSGANTDEQFFGIIYTIDDGDDWQSVESWQKANPNWGVSVSEEDVERKAVKAMQIASAQNNFLTKHLNVWVDADTAWMSMDSWRKCASEQIKFNTISGCDIYIAFDLSSRLDFTSLAVVFKMPGGKTGLVTRHYIPEDTANESEIAQLQTWIADGWAVATQGNKTDYAAIEADILELCARNRVIDVGFDTWQSNYLSTRLQEAGMPMTGVPMTVKYLSEPMKEIEAMVQTGGILHEGNPVLDWMVSCVVCHQDARGNLYPRKEKTPQSKIDGAVAMIMAVGRMIAPQDAEITDLFLEL